MISAGSCVLEWCHVKCVIKIMKACWTGPGLNSLCSYHRKSHTGHQNTDGIMSFQFRSPSEHSHKCLSSSHFQSLLLSSTPTGYRHVYLEGMTEASIFVHITVHDIYGKVSSLPQTTAPNLI